jgi:hypothetical protein
MGGVGRAVVVTLSRQHVAMMTATMDGMACSWSFSFPFPPPFSLSSP